MFGSQSNSVVQNGPVNAPEYGVASALKELVDQCRRNAELSEQLKSTLGIASPRDSRDGSQSAPSLLSTLQLAISAVVESSAGITDCLRHLNS